MTSTTSSFPNATTKERRFPHPRSYSFGVSHASSHGSQWSHRFCASLYTSVQTWSVQSSTQRASKPSARQHSVKQFAHSPHRPARVSSSFTASLYRGNRTDAPQRGDAHAYVSTRLAPCFASSGVGTPGPNGVGASVHPQRPHAGASHHVKNSRLNHESARSRSASRSDIGSEIGSDASEEVSSAPVSSAARAAARATSASASRRKRCTGITASAAARASASSYASTVRTPPSSRRAKSSRCEDTALADASRRNSSAAAARSSSS